MAPTDYAKWNKIERAAVASDEEDEDDELTKKNKKDLEDACRGLIDHELKPFVDKWGLSLDLALIHSMLEDELSALAQASAGEDCDVGVIEYLVTNAHFPNSSIKQKTLDFALFYACQKGTGRICRTLMSLMVLGPDALGADPWGFLEDAAGLTCLHYWSGQADLALISTAVLSLQDMLGKKTLYTSVNDVKTLNGETPLHIAVRANCLPAVRLLLQFGFDLKLASMNGHMAMNLFQSKEMFDLLCAMGGKALLNELPKIDGGAEQGEVGDLGFTPLLAAIINNAFSTDDSVALQKQILDHENVDVNLEGNQLPLTAAIRKNRSVEMIRRMVEKKKADVNKVEKSTKVPNLVLAVTSSSSFATGAFPVAGAATATGEAEDAAGGETGTDERTSSSLPPSAPRNYDDDPSLPWQLAVTEILLKAGADVMLEDFQGYNSITRCMSVTLMKMLLANSDLLMELLKGDPSCGEQAGAQVEEVEG
eukprot:g2368.t1